MSIQGSQAAALRWELSGFGDEIDDDPRVQAAVMRALGASHIEVRSAWGTNIVDLSEEQLATLKGILDEAGLNVSAIASPIGKVDVALPVEHEVERLGRALRAAEALGAPYIRIFSFYYEGKAPEEVRDAVIERMTALARRAEGTGVTLVHENEKDIFGDIPSRVADIVTSVDSPALKLAWDPANFVQVGVKPFTDGYELLHVELDDRWRLREAPRDGGGDLHRATERRQHHLGALLLRDPCDVERARRVGQHARDEKSLAVEDPHVSAPFRVRRRPAGPLR